MLGNPLSTKLRELGLWLSGRWPLLVLHWHPMTSYHKPLTPAHKCLLGHTISEPLINWIFSTKVAYQCFTNNITYQLLIYFQVIVTLGVIHLRRGKRLPPSMDFPAFTIELPDLCRRLRVVRRTVVDAPAASTPGSLGFVVDLASSRPVTWFTNVYFSNSRNITAVRRWNLSSLILSGFSSWW